MKRKSKRRVIKSGEQIQLNGKMHTITSVHYAGLGARRDSRPGDPNRVVKILHIGVKPKVYGCSTVQMEKTSDMVVECD